MQLLTGLNVVDMAVGMAPALIAKFLHDNGATVHRVAPPEGDPFAVEYPAYHVWHQGALTGYGAEVLAMADICLLGGEDFPGLARRENATQLAAAHPHLVILVIEGSPPDYPSLPACEVLAQAGSGLCYEQFSTRPLFMGFQPANYGAALQGLCGLLAALYARETSGTGQVVRTSLVEGALTWAGMGWADFEHPTQRSSFVNPKDPTPLIFQCADGTYIHFAIGAAGSKYRLYQLLAIDDPTVQPGDSGMPDIHGNPRNFYGDIDVLTAHIATRGSQELLEAMWQAGLPAEPVLAPGGCWNEPQLARNQIIARDADGKRHIANPIIVNASPAPKAAQPAPAVAGEFQPPLAGIRVIDFGAYLAGPLASAVLADLGADVIKVEPPKGDPSRGLLRNYMVANRGKRAITLDLKAVQDVEVVKRLCLSADVVCNNFRGGVSARLGIDAENLHARQPDLIVLENPGYGAVGPLAGRAGFDMVMQALCGHEVRAGGASGVPLWNRTSMIDVTGGLLGAIGVLASLVHRARTGAGAALEVPLLNASLFLMSELVQDVDGSFAGAAPVNAARTGSDPASAMYETQDGWLAIAVRGAPATLAFLGVLGLKDRLPADRRQWSEESAIVIADTIAQRSLAELQAALNGAGIWNCRCALDGEHVVLNAPVARISHHATLGRVREIGPLYRLSRSPVGNSRPLAGLSEHTAEVLAGLGHVSRSEMTAAGAGPAS